MTDLRRTPLYQNHKDLGGKIVPFAGWELPVLYSSVVEEHNTFALRLDCLMLVIWAKFFMRARRKSLQYMTCNDVSKLSDGQAQYTAIINPQGGVVDDIIIIDCMLKNI
ncbi:MAG: hypothetical protein R3A13_08260 [Bdellovibrionota bacterium]